MTREGSCASDWSRAPKVSKYSVKDRSYPRRLPASPDDLYKYGNQLTPSLRGQRFRLRSLTFLTG